MHISLNIFTYLRNMKSSIVNSMPQVKIISCGLFKLGLFFVEEDLNMVDFRYRFFGKGVFESYVFKVLASKTIYDGSRIINLESDVAP